MTVIFVYLCNLDCCNMDIALLSNMIAELLLDHEEVGLPGLGTFFAETVPASFSDKGFTINPPYRRVNFMPSRSEDDSLVLLYSSSNGIDYDQSKAILQHFLEEVRKELLEKRVVVFPGIGRLRSTRQNNFFFITDEDLDIFPDGFGLPSVSLKNHTETPGEIQSKVAELVAFVDGDPAAKALEAPIAEPEAELDEDPLLEIVEEPEAASEPEPAVEPEPVAEPAVEPEPAAGSVAVVAEPAAVVAEAAAPEQGKKKRFRWWLVPLILIALAAVALATFVILAQAAPDFIDSILYTPEELRILNY